jgi:hypothetical protein
VQDNKSPTRKKAVVFTNIFNFGRIRTVPGFSPDNIRVNSNRETVKDNQKKLDEITFQPSLYGDAKWWFFVLNLPLL